MHLFEWRSGCHISGIETHVSAAGLSVAIALAGRQGAGSESVDVHLRDPAGLVVATATFAAAAGSDRVVGELAVPDRQTWWSWDRGEQPIYTLELHLPEHGDRQSQPVTFRHVSCMDEVFRLNGRRLFLRGTHMMASSDDPERIATDLQFLREMGVNAVRLQGQVNTPAFYDACDRAGIVVVPDFPLDDGRERSPALAGVVVVDALATDLIQLIDRARRSRFAPVTGVVAYPFVDGGSVPGLGALEPDRRLEVAEQALRMAFQPLYPSLRLAALHHPAGQGLQPDLVLINDTAEDFVDLRVVLTLLDATNRERVVVTSVAFELGADSVLDVYPGHGDPLPTHPSWRGPHQLEAVVTRYGRRLAYALAPITIDAFVEEIADL